MDKRLLYLLGVLAGGVGVYLAYKWHGKRAETTPGGGSIEVRQASPDSVTIVYTNPQGSTSTITVPRGTEGAVIAMLKRGEAVQEYYTRRSEIYYRKMLREKPVYEIQPVPPGYADYGGVSPRLMERAPLLL